MTRGLPEKMSPAVVRMNQQQLADVGYNDAKVIQHATQPDTDWPEGKPHSQHIKDTRAEKELQKQCEDWLHHHGYSKRVPENMGSPVPSRGWQIHLHKPKGNPKLLDILLLGNDGRFIEIELKVHGGSLDDEQAYLVKQGGHLAYSFDEFVLLVMAWENPGQ